jgi:hypothetical protein
MIPLLEPSKIRSNRLLVMASLSFPHQHRPEAAVWSGAKVRSSPFHAQAVGGLPYF